jgi:hypothetical protein
VTGELREGGIGVVDGEAVEGDAVAFLEKTDERVDDFPLPVFRIFEVEARGFAIGEALEREQEGVDGDVAIHAPIFGERNEGRGGGGAVDFLGGGLGGGDGDEERESEEEAHGKRRCGRDEKGGSETLPYWRRLKT